MEKSKLASIGERLKSSSAQMSRMVSLKVQNLKELLQSPTPESRIVDQATSPSLSSPDWGLNLRICSLINAGELGGAEVVRALKRRISGGGGDWVAVRHSLDLLEACAMNCDKVFSEIASERVVEDMVARLVENPEADRECQVRAMELIRAWGESDDLSYLPVFRQTYENLKRKVMTSQGEDGTFTPVHYSLESYIDQQPLSPPESYPIPGTESDGTAGMSLPHNYGSLSTVQKKEFLEITRNSLEVLSSLLTSAAEPNVTEDDLTTSMLEKCKDSQPVLQRIVQSTADDEGLLFEALNLNDELQQVLSKFEEMQVSKKAEDQLSDEPKDTSPVVAHSSSQKIEPEGSSSVDAHAPPSIETSDVEKSTESSKVEDIKSDAPDLLREDIESSSGKK